MHVTGTSFCGKCMHACICKRFVVFGSRQHVNCFVLSEWLGSSMEKKTVSRSSVTLLDKDVMLDTSGILKSDHSYCNVVQKRAACRGKSTFADLLSKTVGSRQHSIGKHQKQHRSAGRNPSKYVTGNRKSLMPGAYSRRASDGKTSSLYSEMNSAQSSHDLSATENNTGSDGKVFFCSKCGRHFTTANHLMQHMDMNCSQLHCSICRKPFKDLLALKMHRVTCHMSLPKKNRPAELTKPMQYVCNHCGRIFKTAGALKLHVMTHTGERLLACRVAGCNKRFAQHSTRSFHERTHSDDMPHICAVCGRRFKHATTVRLHMSVHTGYKPYQCPSCPMVFRRTCHLQQHLRIHTGERPFACSSCPKCFKDKQSLSRHIVALHTDEVPWRCCVCNKGFKTSSNLRVHMRVHTGEKPYICKVCDTQFSYASSLKSHMHIHSEQD